MPNSVNDDLAPVFISMCPAGAPRCASAGAFSVFCGRTLPVADFGEPLHHHQHQQHQHDDQQHAADHRPHDQAEAAVDKSCGPGAGWQCTACAMTQRRAEAQLPQLTTTMVSEARASAFDVMLGLLQAGETAGDVSVVLNDGVVLARAPSGCCFDGFFVALPTSRFGQKNDGSALRHPWEASQAHSQRSSTSIHREK